MVGLTKDGRVATVFSLKETVLELVQDAALMMLHLGLFFNRHIVR